MRHFNITLLLLGFFQIQGISQNLTFTKFPFDWQLFQRDLPANFATVDVAGVVKQSSGYSKLEARLFNEDSSVAVLPKTLVFAAGKANFNFSINIPAACNNHRLEIYGFKTSNGHWVLEKKAEKLLAGDIFIINGQSNAQAAASPDLSDVDEYTRSWQQPYGWGKLNLSFPGLWGARLANRIADDIGVPVAIFNQAVGALTIDTYLKDSTDEFAGNYGSLLTRFENAGLPRKARTAIWFHGESNAWSWESAIYTNHFQSLVNSWQADFGIQQAFLFQMRFESCNSPRPFIMESHRQCGDLPNVDIMSTTNADHDSCHFYYQNGYKSLGDRMFDLIANRFYGKNVAEVEPPDISKAFISGTSEITIETKNAAADLEILGFPWSDFQTEGAKVAVTSGSISGTTLKLTFAKPVSAVTGISYLGHPGKKPDWIFNSRGVGLLTFHNFPVSGGSGGGGLDCSTILIETAGDSILIKNLSAPVIGVQVFDNQWVQKFSCLGNCDEPEQIVPNLFDGNYFVKADFLTANWQSVCKKEAFIEVKNAPPPPTEIDLELSGSTATPDPGAFSFVSVKFVLKNNGGKIATNVRVNVPQAAGLVYRGGNEFSATKGDFNLGAADWTLPNLPPGDSAVLILNYYNLNKNLKNVFAQVTAAGQTDADSSPGNATGGTANEDDEFLIKLNETIVPPPPTGNPDLEISLAADNLKPGQWRNVELVLTLKNMGTAAATDVQVSFLNQSDPDVFSKLVYSSHIISPGTTFDYWFGNWKIAKLAAGETVVLKYQSFVKVADEVSIFSEVKSTNEVDLDSSPGNSIDLNPSEDDEVLLILNAVNLLQPGDRKSISQPTDLPDFLIFPNPAGEMLFINFEKRIEKNIEITIVDINGINRFTKNVKFDQPSVLPIDLSGWKNGVYFLKIQAAGMRSVSRKIVVSRMY